jgi:3',5'-cyclic AMP phosphodiesterase CpdA
MRIAQLTDIHFGDENADAVKGVLDHLAADPPDAVVLTGDLTRQGDEAEFAAAKAWANALPGHVIVVPGNHDTPYYNPYWRVVAPWRRFRKWFGHTRPRYHGADFSLVGVNTARGVQFRANWSKGAIASSQTREALDALSSAPSGHLRVVALHHPLVEMLGGPMTGKVHGGEAAAKTFAEGGVDLVLSGHLHAPFALTYPHGDGRTLAVGGSTLSIRERGVPPGLNMIESDGECIRVTALAWTGSHFEAWRTWAFDRRRNAHP